MTNIVEDERTDGFVAVAEAQRRYLSGEKSRRWRYQMAKAGKITHHRVGDSILFRTADIEKFIAESRKAEHAEALRPEPAPAMPVVPPPVKRLPLRKKGRSVFRPLEPELVTQPS